MRNTLFKKGLVVGIIVLFIGFSIISATGKIDSVRYTKCILNNGSLLGFVKNSSGKPIEGALVRVHFHGTYEENYTNENGFYHVTNIPICKCLKYTTCSKKDYKTKWVFLGIGENTTHDFILASNEKKFKSEIQSLDNNEIEPLDYYEEIINSIFYGCSNVVENITLKDEDYIYYYDPESAGWSGFGPSCACDEWMSAIRLTQEELEPYNEWNLTGVNVLRYGGGEHLGTIEIFGEGTPSQPGQIIASAPYYFNEPNWFRVNLNVSIPIKEHNEIWIAVVWHTKEPYIYPHAVDNYFPVFGKSEWVYLNGSGWTELIDYGWYFSWCMAAIVQRNETNNPPNTPNITGPTHGKTGVNYNFTFVADDPDFDYITYYIDWGDGSTEKFGPYPSGLEIKLSHTWTEKGSYLIKCKAKDIHDVDSQFEVLTVTMPRDKATSISPLLRFLDHFPLIQALLFRLRLL